MMFARAHQILNSRDVDARTLVESIRFLLAYVHYHFQAEEHAMEKIGYPKMEHHKRQHRRVMEEVVAIRDSAVADFDRDKLLSRIYAFFQDWFIYHIKEVDSAFAAYVREHGSKKDESLPTAANLVSLGQLQPEMQDIEEKWNPNPELADGVELKSN